MLPQHYQDDRRHETSDLQIESRDTSLLLLHLDDSTLMPMKLSDQVISQTSRKCRSKNLYTGIAIGLSLILCYLVFKLRMNGGSSTQAVWLIATISPVSGIQRRAIIRNTWQKLYKNEIITTRFVLSNPGTLWASIIEAENATYGDIIILPNIEESRRLAVTVKPFEFFKYITSRQDRWEYVSKIDDDSFLDATTFYKTFLVPRLSIKEGRLKKSMNRTIIARTLRRSEFDFPGGQFYTMSWDIVTILADLYTKNPNNPHHDQEDPHVGRLLYEANENWHLVDLPNPIAFDYKKDASNGSAYAAKGANLDTWRHAVGPEAINPHKMKNDTDYLEVAACFDENGVIYPS